MAVRREKSIADLYAQGRRIFDEIDRRAEEYGRTNADVERENRVAKTIMRYENNITNSRKFKKEQKQLGFQYPPTTPLDMNGYSEAVKTKYPQSTYMGKKRLRNASVGANVG